MAAGERTRTRILVEFILWVRAKVTGQQRVIGLASGLQVGKRKNEGEGAGKLEAKTGNDTSENR